ncbi:hypothetical protein EDE12_102402 [Methylosinus sp. sav-2]|uniref:hypothetical protein n=1 Tax=Methylosinus sp. sav-2 TaxID=2485168 RepID=UPI0010656851|nr:hypothetical protein [Methylosinus sp. sav-2]TDX65913.1 hypothetical protein EDE12_102402 [Methylosinus sp. sav-2]
MNDKRRLVEEVEKFANETFSRPYVDTFLRDLSKPMRTHAIKELFIRLGRTNNFKSQAGGMSTLGIGGEWLYDLIWYEDEIVDGNYFMTNLPLALECEWGVSVSSSGDVDGDFQKLVQARAEVRVWVTAIANEELAEKHIRNAQMQASRFKLSQVDDQYVLIIFVWSSREALIRKFAVGIHDMLCAPRLAY